MSHLQMKQIVKSFHSIPVLKGVDFTVKKGEIHALLGMNGAGKSTLMKILSGDYQSDGGIISIFGQNVHFSSPKDAKKAGIGIVVQEVDAALIPNLSVYENVMMDHIVSSSNHLPLFHKVLRQKAKQLLDRVGLDIDLNQRVDECSLHEKQLILLAKILSSSAQFIILDEPTAPLSEEETKRLFSIMKQLKNDGVGIIYISHKLHEVKEICDSVTILRDGNVVHQSSVNEIELKEIVRYMAGESKSLPKQHVKKVTDNILLEVKDLIIPKKNTIVNVKVRQGEIVGIAGVVGAGKTEMAQAIFGLEQTNGTWIINGSERKIRSPKDAINAGMAFIPEERRKQGLFLEETISVNLSVQLLKKFSKWNWILKHQEKQNALKLIQALSIQPSHPSAITKYLSGGNQQKVVVGKWLDTDSQIFIFDEPTKGIDVSAKAEIFHLIQELAAKGKGILYFTSDLRELLDIADRILVLVDGFITAELTGSEATYEKLIYLTNGGEWHGTYDYLDQYKTKEKQTYPLPL
jgi:simple sugar transport system ATP-binding protein